jgi:CRP/FNR family transcriptional regulator
MFRLKDIPLFSSLNDTQLLELQAHIHMKDYDQGSIVFYEGEKSEYVHILLDGDVRLYKTSPGGKEIYLHRMTAPSALALYPALESESFPATCAFVTDGVVGLLSLEKLHKCLENLDFSLAMIKAISKRMRLLEDLLHKETVFSSEAKVADLISQNPKLFQHMKNNEIATILNMTPETFSRILSKLKKEKIISISNHLVTVLDQTSLQNIIDSNSMKT